MSWCVPLCGNEKWKELCLQDIEWRKQKLREQVEQRRLERLRQRTIEAEKRRIEKEQRKLEKQSVKISRPVIKKPIIVKTRTKSTERYMLERFREWKQLKGINYLNR